MKGTHVYKPQWFHEVVLPHAKEIRFLRGRLKFGGAKKSAPFPSMVCIFERENGLVFS